MKAKPPPSTPLPNTHTRNFWEGVGNGQPIIQRYTTCGYFQTAPGSICLARLSFDLAGATASGEGNIHSFCTSIQTFHPHFAHEPSFVLAVAEVDEQSKSKMITNIIDVNPDTFRVGDLVELMFIPLSDDFMPPVFHLAPK